MGPGWARAAFVLEEGSSDPAGGGSLGSPGGALHHTVRQVGVWPPGEVQLRLLHEISGVLLSWPVSLEPEERGVDAQGGSCLLVIQESKHLSGSPEAQCPLCMRPWGTPSLPQTCEHISRSTQECVSSVNSHGHKLRMVPMREEQPGVSRMPPSTGSLIRTTLRCAD